MPLMAVIFFTPLIAFLFLDLQITRSEAHRDMFDKTTTTFLLPSALMSAHVNDELSAQFGALTTENRQHAFAAFPPAVPDGANDPNGLIDPPGAVSIGAKVSGSAKKDLGSLDLFEGGFPNNTTEGWEYTPRRGMFEQSDDIHFMTYAATIRSPWTYLGWPFVAAQDMIFEPAQMQGWAGDQVKVDEDMRGRLKIAE